MKRKLKQKWAEFKQGQPGRRFQERYERKRRARHNQPWYKSVLEALLALLFILIGFVLAVMPGPAVLFFTIAAVMLAGQSRIVARLLDWTEVKLRQLLAWITAWWKRASVPARGAVVLLGMAAGALAGYLTYQLFSGA